MASPPLPILVLLCVCLSCGCGPNPTAPLPQPSPNPLPSPPWFEDITAQSGLKFIHQSGASGQYRMTESIGSGCALFDANNDGRLDIYLIQNAGPDSGASNQFYLQQPDGSFRNVSRGSGLDVAGYGMGVAAGDVNNDGWTDLVVSEFGAVRLFVNQHNQTFTELPPDAGLVNPGWATALALVDFDRDGRLDLVVGNYVDYDPTHQCYTAAGDPDFCGVTDAPITPSRLFRNVTAPNASARQVRFQDVTIPAGLAHAPGPALGVVCADFNADHWPDMLFADDLRPNRLFVNRRDGTFTEEGASRGLAYTALGQVAADMGIGLADVNRDALPDIFITHLTSEFHNLWIQTSPGLFQDQTAQAGLLQTHWRGTGFGTVLADFNHDGAPDIAVTNGKVKREGHIARPVPEPFDAAAFWAPYAERGQLFANDGRGAFTDLSPHQLALCGQPVVGRGLACGDIDNDGDLDLLITVIDGPAILLRNVTPKDDHHWLLVRAVDPALGGRDALGAEIRVVTGGETRLGFVNPAYGYLSSHDPRAHFGLGQHATIDSIRIRWPDGAEEHFPGGNADRIVTLTRGAGASPAWR